MDEAAKVSEVGEAPVAAAEQEANEAPSTPGAALAQGMRRRRVQADLAVDEVLSAAEMRAQERERRREEREAARKAEQERWEAERAQRLEVCSTCVIVRGVEECRVPNAVVSNSGKLVVELKITRMLGAFFHAGQLTTGAQAGPRCTPVISNK